jgi:CheY-like chemotaxis protein
MNDAEFRKQVQDALAHLYDTAYLAGHPLLPELVHMPDSTRATRAQKLRSILKQAIEETRPQQDLPSTSPEWRSYNALRYRYTQGMSMAQVENTLGISQRQLQRDFHKGLDAVIVVLEGQRIAGQENSRDEILNAANELQALQNEMNHWQLLREPSEVAALIAGVQKMLQPLVGDELRQLRIELPATLKPVLVDSTLMRQALFQILRLLFSAVRESDEREIIVRAKAVENQIKICLDSNADIHTAASDWQMAKVLIERQGGTLENEFQRAAITLPQADPPRVLVIDDNRAIHDLFERYLTPNFYQVVHAHSGTEAVQTAIETEPDVILLDVMMPAVDGWQVLADIKQDEKTRDIPIVVCSVLKEPELALSLGAHAYLKKPVERLELLATLARLREAGTGRAAAVP